MYLHAIRIPLAVVLNARWIIGGERECHDGKAKINQIATALDRFEVFVNGFGTTLAQPLRYIDSGSEIADIVGSEWENVGEQVKCVLSGNYRGVDGEMIYAEVDADRFVSDYLDDYAIPLAEEVIRDFINGVEPDYKEITGRLLGVIDGDG